MTASNQQLVFIGSYTTANQPGIYTFNFDDATGALVPLGAYTGIANPSFVVVHPNGLWLYAVGENAPGTVHALKFERETGTLAPLNEQPSGGDAPCHLLIDGTGKWLFVANYSSGSASVFPIQTDGSLGAVTDHVQHQGRGPNAERQEGPHAHSTTLTPDNRYAIIADLGIDQLVVYEFDAAAGKLVPHHNVNTAPGAGPRHATFHPNGCVLYIANELGNTVTVYEYDAVSGELRELQTLSTLPPGASENTVADIHISPSAERVYVSNRGHNSIAVFAADTDGRLEQLAIPPCSGDTPRNFALAPGGKFVVVANQNSGEVVVLPRLIGSGELGAPITRVAVPKAVCVVFC